MTLFRRGHLALSISDSLIRLYPEQLFIDAAVLIAIFASLSAAAMLACWQFVRLRRPRPA